MANKINLITGENYTLSELFSGERRIIIPDLQRDYCWGNADSATDKHGLVPRFIDTLVDQFKNNRHGHRLNLGLIYGYETPANYVQLCDGQQRITTLFLLLGMLNKWTNNTYRQYLMSDFEFFEDDHEPYLQYSIRESSLYFLSDLVYKFFANNDNVVLQTVNEIYDELTGESCDWFYGEYTTDPSVLSMLRTLRIIECEKPRLNDLGLHEFSDFILDRLSFIYYDMGNRANGEETFVLINTTGEPLSPTENLKPLVINDKINDHILEPLTVNGQKIDDADSKVKAANAWEEMETWFWRNRDKSNFDTAGNGFCEFLRWVMLMSDKYSNKETKEEILANPENFRFPHDIIPITEVIEYFNAFVKLFLNYRQFIGSASYNKMTSGINITTFPGQGGTLRQIECFELLPLIEYKRQNSNATPRDIRRIYEFFHNLAKTSNVAKSVNILVLSAIDICRNYKDLLGLLSPVAKITPMILTIEEQIKLQIISNNPALRDEIEDAFWAAQHMKVDNKSSLFQGEILPMINWANDSNVFSLERFNNYANLLKSVLSPLTNNDLTRRALLAFGYPGYPLDNVSFGWGSNWKEILSINNGAPFKVFLDEVENRGLSDIISRPNCKVEYLPIVRYPEILAYCDQKNIRPYPTWGMTLCKRQWARLVPMRLAYILLQLGCSVSNHSEREICGWRLSYTEGDNEMTLSKPGQCDLVIKSVVKDFLLIAIKYENAAEYSVQLRNLDIEKFITRWIKNIKNIPSWGKYAKHPNSRHTRHIKSFLH